MAGRTTSDELWQADMIIDTTQNQQVERSDFSGLLVVVEGLQNEHTIKKGARADRPDTLRWLSQSHKDEVLTFLGVKCQRKRTYLCFVQTGPFYRDLGVVISSVTSPRFTEANEYEHNFLNGYRS